MDPLQGIADARKEAHNLEEAVPGEAGTGESNSGLACIPT